MIPVIQWSNKRLPVFDRHEGISLSHYSIFIGQSGIPDEGHWCIFFEEHH